MTTYTPLQLLPLPSEPHHIKPWPSALTVDPYSDILWTGTSGGIVSAWCNPVDLSANVRFPAHGREADTFVAAPGQAVGVRQIRVTDREIWTLTAGGIGGRRRGGAAKWSVRDTARALRSMTPNPINSHEVLAGGVAGMTLVNTARGEIAGYIDYGHALVHLAPLPRSVVAASSSGNVSLLDPRIGFKTASGIGSVQAHTGGLSGADATGHLVATWGWTHMQGHPMPDPLVRLYDVRTMRALPPISFPAGPAFVVLHPIDPSQIFISSQQGMLQILDMADSSNSTVQQLDVTSYVTSMAISPTGDYLVFGDADGHVHLWTNQDIGPEKMDANGRLSLNPFNGYEGVKPDWPDNPNPPPQINWDDRTPLNMIGMPYYSEPLLSNIPSTDYAPVTSPFFNPPEPVPPSVLASMKMVDFIGYASMPKELKGKRCVVQARPGAGKNATGKGFIHGRRESAPRFRSEKDRKRKSSIHEIDEETPAGEIPKYYRKVEIKYSKFGVEDFDFDFYNHTEYSGLETDILNSYTNALLQALHYTRPIRKIATCHICVDCKKEHCLLCEAGFLFRMLEDARGINCQASNFSRAFSATPQASALGLMDNDDKSTAPYGSLIQNFNRWLLSTFSTESFVDGETFDFRPRTDIGDLSLHPLPSAIEQVLGIRTKTINTCQNCNHVATRENTLHVVDLQYPFKNDNKSFCYLLQSSIVRDTMTRASCSNCKAFTALSSRRELAGTGNNILPPVISINAMVASPELFNVWKDKAGKQFLPRLMNMKVSENGDLAIVENGEGVQYEVHSMVVQVQTSAELPAHLISFVKMPVTEDSAESWVVFNDFSVRPVKEEEVFSFREQWKVPAVIMLQRVDSPAILDFSRLRSELDPKVLMEDVSMAWNRRSHMIKHQNFKEEELPEPGTLIAIDAEFVALQQEEMEFRSDGTKNILRPSHMSLARVSVLRGSGALESKPFIDDYILTKEAVVDYLTEYSGIKSGDLDVNNSPHTLVPLKVAYKKLRLLVDRGCIFIGHGLSKDFRTINIFVPPDQVMDTVNLYTIPGRQRKLSLRFLTWFLLKTDIQTQAHDSIEDARYALLLYKLYQQFEEDGRFEDVMEDIFAEGQKLGFKPPHDRSTSPAIPPNQPPVANPAPSPSNNHGRSRHGRNLQAPNQHNGHGTGHQPRRRREQ